MTSAGQPLRTVTVPLEERTMVPVPPFGQPPPNQPPPEQEAEQEEDQTQNVPA